MFIVEGRKGIQEALSNRAEITRIFTTNLELKLGGAIRPERISTKEMESISALSSPSDALATVRIPTVKTDTNALATLKVLALDDIKDPGNLGTIIRTAEWFGIDHIIVSPQTVDEYNPKVVQSTMGSLFRVSIHRTELVAMLERLKKIDAHIFSAEMNGDDSALLVSKKSAGVLVIGSESHGVSKAVSTLADYNVTIPRKGEAESLNAAVATGILLYDWMRN